MHKSVLAAAALATFALPAAARAQDEPSGSPMAEMAEKMADPARQAEMALLLQAMGEIMLDMPVGPMMEAAAEMAGDQARKVDPDTTLRQIAPEASRVPEEIAKATPQMMRAMGGMAKGMDKMMPALRDMAARMEEALPDTRD